MESAAVRCDGPGTPVPITGSNALAVYAGNFQGVTFTADQDPDGIHHYWLHYVTACYAAAAAAANAATATAAAAQIVPPAINKQSADPLVASAICASLCLLAVPRTSSVHLVTSGSHCQSCMHQPYGTAITLAISANSTWACHIHLCVSLLSWSSAEHTTAMLQTMDSSWASRTCHQV